jgi:hypothetical protein
LLQRLLHTLVREHFDLRRLRLFPTYDTRKGNLAMWSGYSSSIKETGKLTFG